MLEVYHITLPPQAYQRTVLTHCRRKGGLLSTVYPVFASEKESCPSPLSGCEHAQARSVQTLEDRDLLFARTVPKSHMRQRAKAVLSSVRAPVLQLVSPIQTGMMGGGNICVGP